MRYNAVAKPKVRPYLLKTVGGGGGEGNMRRYSELDAQILKDKVNTSDRMKSDH